MTDIDALIEQLTNVADCESEKLYPKDLLEAAAALAELRDERDWYMNKWNNKTDIEARLIAEIAKLREQVQTIKDDHPWYEPEALADAKAEIAKLHETCVAESKRMASLMQERDKLREALEEIAKGDDHFAGNPAKWPMNIARAALGEKA